MTTEQDDAPGAAGWARLAWEMRLAAVAWFTAVAAIVVVSFLAGYAIAIWRLQ